MDSSLTGTIDPVAMIRPGRTITGMSAILLPIDQDGEVDFEAFTGLVERTVRAGLIPAVNMDTGFVHLIDDATRRRVLRRTAAVVQGVGGGFVAGVYVRDRPGQPLDAPEYQSGIEEVAEAGGIPILFQSFGLTRLSDDDLVDAYETILADADAAYFFELGKMFAPFGRIYDLPVYRRLMMIPKMLGAKHSSLRRDLEWQRLRVRDQQRPEFRVLTGNDRAIDMVRYGSDYLLGLASFAPDAFALRDRMWADRDSRFEAINDVLQYLGAFAFRPPVPAYKHSAAMFLALRGWIDNDDTMAGCPMRPASDRAVLELMVDDLQRLMDGFDE